VIKLKTGGDGGKWTVRQVQSTPINKSSSDALYSGYTECNIVAAWGDECARFAHKINVLPSTNQNLVLVLKSATSPLQQPTLPSSAFISKTPFNASRKHQAFIKGSEGSFFYQLQQQVGRKINSRQKLPRKVSNGRKSPASTSCISSKQIKDRLKRQGKSWNRIISAVRTCTKHLWQRVLKAISPWSTG